MSQYTWQLCPRPVRHATPEPTLHDTVQRIGPLTIEELYITSRGRVRPFRRVSTKSVTTWHARATKASTRSGSETRPC